MRIFVSACLLGINCRYDGDNNQIPQLKQLMAQHTVIPICPEMLGGLPTPRPPAERSGNRVLTADGTDVTDKFVRGAAEVLRLSDLYKCKRALLKDRSPSCGCGMIYDGNFTGELVEGDGICAQILRRAGFKLYTESDIDEMLENRPLFYSVT